MVLLHMPTVDVKEAIKTKLKKFQEMSEIWAEPFQELAMSISKSVMYICNGFMVQGYFYKLLTRAIY